MGLEWVSLYSVVFTFGRYRLGFILNKQSRIADKVLSSSLRVGRGANNSSP